MGSKPSLLSLTATFVVATWASSADAGLIITINDDGFGMTRATINGTFDVTSGIPSGPTVASDFFAPNPFPDLTIRRRTTDSTESRWLSFFPPDLSSGPMLQSTFGVRPSGMVADDILINLGRNFATIVGYDGNYVGSLNEDLHYDDLAFSHFNTGTWVYGGGSTTLNGITLQIGSAAVPEPSSMALLMIGAVGVAARRKRRIPIA